MRTITVEAAKVNSCRIVILNLIQDPFLFFVILTPDPVRGIQDPERKKRPNVNRLVFLIFLDSGSRPGMTVKCYLPDFFCIATSIGEARKIDEYVPATRPIINVNAK